MSHSPTAITEADLRGAMRRHLDGLVSSRGGRVAEELQIEQGAARVDLAVIGELLEAFELKSDLDNFGRLHNQIHAYNRVFDRITLVTGAQFSGAALALMPSWWGVMQATKQPDGSLELSVLRDATPNLSQEARSVAMFLWRDEAIEILEAQTGERTPKRATRLQLHQRLAETLSLTELRSSVTRLLLERGGATAATKPAPHGGSSHLDASCSGFHYLT